jgi:transcriptional regulator with XRE-family HTH domain
MANKLSAVLESRHLSQSQLAVLSQVSRVTINKACRGDEVALETWVKLARALGCNVYEISPDAYGRLVGAL